MRFLIRFWRKLTKKDSEYMKLNKFSGWTSVFGRYFQGSGSEFFADSDPDSGKKSRIRIKQKTLIRNTARNKSVSK